MWTKRERAMLKMIAAYCRPFAIIATVAKKRRDDRVYNLAMADMWLILNPLRAAIRAAREVKAPDYEKMWEELKGIHTGNAFRMWMAEIERRHGGKA